MINWQLLFLPLFTVQQYLFCANSIVCYSFKTHPSLSGGVIYTFGVCILGYIFAFAAVKIFNVRFGCRGTMINTFVNANTIFIGLPFIIVVPIVVTLLG